MMNYSSDLLKPNNSLLLFLLVLVLPLEVDLLFCMLPMFHKHPLRDNRLLFLVVYLCLFFTVLAHSQPG